LIRESKHYHEESASPSTVEPPNIKRQKIDESNGGEQLESPHVKSTDENICKEELVCLPTPEEKYILDIDLDFFSVTNPFLQDYTQVYKKISFRLIFFSYYLFV